MFGYWLRSFHSISFPLNRIRTVVLASGKSHNFFFSNRYLGQSIHVYLLQVKNLYKRIQHDQLQTFFSRKPQGFIINLLKMIKYNGSEIRSSYYNTKSYDFITIFYLFIISSYVHVLHTEPRTLYCLHFAHVLFQHWF